MTNKSNVWNSYLDAITPPYDFDLSVQALGNSMPPAIYNRVLHVARFEIVDIGPPSETWI